MEPEPEQVNIARYLRFVVIFLVMLFGALGIYQYYYGSQVRELQERRLETQAVPASGVQDVAGEGTAQ